MSYYDDYVADGLCCESCGGYMDGSEPGHSRMCWSCQRATKEQAKPAKKAKRK